MFLTSKLEVPTLNKIWSFLLLANSKKWVKSLQNFNFNFDRRKTLRKSTITFNSRIVDRHIEFPYCMLLFDKSNKQPAKLEAAVTWSKSNLNIINICEEMYHQFSGYVCNQCLSPLTLWVRTPLRRGVLDTTLCEKGCQWLVTGRWFSLGTPVSSTNLTDRHDITEISVESGVNHQQTNHNIYSVESIRVFIK
jgi:hypothetical protein